MKVAMTVDTLLLACVEDMENSLDNRKEEAGLNRLDSYEIPGQVLTRRDIVPDSILGKVRDALVSHSRRSEVVEVDDTIDQREPYNSLEFNLPSWFQLVEDELHGLFGIGEVSIFRTVNVPDPARTDKLDEPVIPNHIAGQAAAPGIVTSRGHLSSHC